MSSTGDHTNKEDNLPPGFRFHPTDEELITFYLMNKISDATFTGRAIADVDLNKCEPWELPAKAKMGEKEWYFFSLRDRKYPTGVRTNRATNTGYWKTTGKDKEIYNSVTSEMVGMKKTLVFYRGRAPRGEKSNWVMHEYRMHPKSGFRTSKDEWVVCRVFQKSAGVKKFPPTNHQSSSRAANSYNLELIGPSVNVLPSPMMQLGHDPQFSNYGRNYMTNAELSELSRVLRGGGGGVITAGSTSSPNNLPFQPQFNYPSNGGGGFTISGLNLNLGVPSTLPTRPMEQSLHQSPLAMNHNQDVANSSMMASAGGSLGQDQHGYGIDMNNGNVPPGNRYMNMVDQCVDLDNYWPPPPY